MKKVFLFVVMMLTFMACSDEEKSDEGIVVELSVGYENAVDLGLSVRWANRNVGAETEDELGDYFAWGETIAKDTFILNNYQYYDTVGQIYIYIGKEIAQTQYDAALMNWGGNWRMPTLDEVQELIDECDWKWEWGTSHHTFGYKVTGPNGNSIYLPAAGGYYKDDDPYTLWSIGDFGYYWTSSIANKTLGNLLRFNYNKPTLHLQEIYKGLSVRPVVDIQ